MVDWNRKKGHPDPNSFKANQIMLEKGITELNRALRELNAPLLPPQLEQDMYCYRKKKPRHVQSKRTNYTLLLDGVHPGKMISQLWLLRVKLFSKKM